MHALLTTIRTARCFSFAFLIRRPTPTLTSLPKKQAQRAGIDTERVKVDGLALCVDERLSFVQLGGQEEGSEEVMTLVRGLFADASLTKVCA